MRELERRKLDEPRPETVPAMYVKQPFHVQQYFDRAAHHGVLAIGARTERQERRRLSLRDPDAATQRVGHTQHRTAGDVDARMDDVWGALHGRRGAEAGGLAGHASVRGGPQQAVRIYVGNLSGDAGLEEVKAACGLLDPDTLLCDPDTAEARGVYSMLRPPAASSHLVIAVTDPAVATRIVQRCRTRPPRVSGRLLRVDVQAHDGSNMRWTTGHRPASGDWASDHAQLGGAAYGVYETSYGRSHSGGLQYDNNGIAKFLRRHPAGRKTYPSVAEGRRRGAVKHGLVQWYPWMPAWEGPPGRAAAWLPTPSFPGGGEPGALGCPRAMDDARMRLRQRRHLLDPRIA